MVTSQIFRLPSITQKTRPELEVIERIPTGEQYALMSSQTNPLRGDVNAVDYSTQRRWLNGRDLIKSGLVKSLSLRVLR